MRGVLIFLFWCWFAVSMAILARRLYRKVNGTGEQHTAGRTEAATTWSPASSVRSSLGSPTGTVPTGPGASPQWTAPTWTPLPTDRASQMTIADALHGIHMPCQLTPLTGGAADFQRRAAFVTVGYPAEVVTPEIAGEIERLGMTFNTTGPDTAMAEREDVRMKVAVRSVGSAIKGVADTAYPTAPEHSVVVEFELA